MKLLMVRHGETDANVHNQLDTAVPGLPLDETGLVQAQSLVDRWQEMKMPRPHAIFASNLTRTQQTITPLAEHFELPVHVHEGLREISAGDLEMNNDYDSLVKYLDTVRQWMQGQLKVPMPGGETGAQVLARFDEGVQACVKEAKRCAAHLGQDEGEAVALVCAHGAVLRYWNFLRTKGTSFQLVATVPVKNTSIITAEGELGNWVLDLWDSRPAKEWPIDSSITPDMLVPSRAAMDKAMRDTLRK